MCLSSPKIPEPSPPPPAPPAPTTMAKTALSPRQAKRKATGTGATRGVSALRIRRPSVSTRASGGGANISY